jgi:hypothetical protein
VDQLKSFTEAWKWYIKNRTLQVEELCRKFFKEYLANEADRARFLRAVALMDARGEAAYSQGAAFQINRQLMVMRTMPGQDPSYFRISAISPLVHRVLIDFTRTEVGAVFDQTVAHILEDAEFTNDTKGRILEKYLTRQIAAQKKFSILYTPVTSTGSISSDKKKRKHVDIAELDIVYFDGQKPPTPSAEQWSRLRPIAFIPNNPNFPGVDLILWVPTQTTSTVIVIQATLAVEDHSYDFDPKPWLTAFTPPGAASSSSSSSSSSSVAVSKSTRKTTVPSVICDFVWLGDDIKVPRGSHGESFLLTWRDLCELDQKQGVPMFPLLRHIPLQKRTQTALEKK